MTLTLKKMSVAAAFLLLAVGFGMLLGNQRPAQAESLAQQIVCKVFTQLNEVSQGVKVPFPFFRPGCPNRGGIEVTKKVNGGSASSADFLIHVKDASGSDISGSPQPGSSVGLVYGNVPAGGYTVTETGPSGYASSFGGDCNSSGNLTVSAGVLSSCTITNTFTGSGAPACADEVDNDNDGFTDSRDPNCHTDGDPTNSSSYDPAKITETGPLPACWDGADNDGDGLIDTNDPGCASATDNDESNGGGGTPAQCADRTDNDGDGKIDLADPGCTGPTDNSEADIASPAQCSDDADNDGDSLTDENDPNCHTDGDASNPDSYSPERGENDPLPACGDGADNDGDGKTDMADPGCTSRTDTSEEDPAPPSSGGGGPPSTPAPASGGGGNGPIVGSLGAVVGRVLGIATTTLRTCDTYLNAFIREGKPNDPEQVRRLQTILRDFEGARIEITGVYDKPTVAAVNAFQAKYASEVLTPWKITKPTGFVYLTTRKKLNEVFCRGLATFPLTPEQQAIIEHTISRVWSSGTSSRGGQAVGRVAPGVAPSRSATGTTSVPGTGTAVATTTSEVEVTSGVWDAVVEFIWKYRGILAP